jgi:hypothetical protein
VCAVPTAWVSSGSGAQLVVSCAGTSSSTDARSIIRARRRALRIAGSCASFDARMEEHMESTLLDVAGRRRSPVTMPGYGRGRPPRNKGMRYPANPPTVEEIVAVMRGAGPSMDGDRLRALVVLLWRAGLRISEALDLAAASVARSEWIAGPGSSLSPGSGSVPSYLSARCCASSMVRRRVADGSPPRRVGSFDVSRRRPVCAGVSRRTSSVMPMPLRWLTKACRSSSSSASSVTPTWGSQAFTYRASTARRSSIPSMPGPRR